MSANSAYRLLSRSGNRKICRDMLTITVEGNIGSGKTTLLNHFINEHKEKVKVWNEPVDKWRNVEGHNMLELMYQNPKKWSFAFQQYVQLTMFQLHKEAYDYVDTRNQCLVKLMERSLLSARYCFVENLYRNKCLQEVEYVILDKWFRKLMRNECTKLDYIIYLKTSPEVCLERIKQRCRKEEEVITLDFLRNLHDLHDNWLLKQTSVPVIAVNGDSTISEVHESLEKCSRIMFNTNNHKVSFKHCL